MPAPAVLATSLIRDSSIKQLAGNVMEPVQHGTRDHRGAPDRGGREPDRNELTDALVSPGFVEVAHVLEEDLEQVTFAERDDVVETLPPHAAEQAFAVSVRLRRSNRRRQDPRAQAGADAERGRIAELLRDPGRARVSRHRYAHDLAGPELDDDPGKSQKWDEEGKERPEPDIVHLEEVARPDLVQVIVQERRPTLARMRARSRRTHVLLHGALGDANADL